MTVNLSYKEEMYKSMTETWWVTWLCYNLNSILVSMDSFKFENRV